MSDTLPVTLIHKAHKFYMAGVTPSNISQLTKIPMSDLNLLIMGDDRLGTSPDCWSVKRNGLVDEVVVAASLERLDFTLKCTGLASSILHESLSVLNQQVRDGGRTLTVREMESMSSIVEKLDKIVRLEKGSPTEIVSRAGLSVDEARAILKADPFAPITIEAECVSVVTNEELDAHVIKQLEDFDVLG